MVVWYIFLKLLISVFSLATVTVPMPAVFDVVAAAAGKSSACHLLTGRRLISLGRHLCFGSIKHLGFSSAPQGFGHTVSFVLRPTATCLGHVGSDSSLSRGHAAYPV